MKQAVILVGGKGTRLGALAEATPKPMMTVLGRTRFLDLLIDNIARHGVEEILLLAGHLGEKVREAYDQREVRGARVSVVVEQETAGTAGALRFVSHRLDDVFLMTNGDSFLDMNYLALACALEPDDLGVIALRQVEDVRRFGRVEMSGGKISAFREKDATKTEPGLISGGVYVLRKRVLDAIESLPCSLETDVFPGLAARRRLAGYATEGFFIDIGLPETLEEARRDLPRRFCRGAAFFDRDGTLNVDGGYTYRPEALIWQPDAIAAIKTCNDAGYLVFVVTNQSGIARGFYDESEMNAFHSRMRADLAAAGAHIDSFYHSPWHADGVVPQFNAANHPDRKPGSGMIRRALLEWRADPARSFMIGDTDADMAAAAAIGLRGAKVKPGEILAAAESGMKEARGATDRDSFNAQLAQRAEEARSWLFDYALPLWWERGFDRATNTFHERLNLDGSPQLLPRRIRVQARQTFVYALAGDIGWKGPWRNAVEAGVSVLLEKGIHPDGGTRHLLDEGGSLLDDRRDLYDASFVTFALAHAGRVLGRTDCLAAAETIARWVDASWAHPDGGYREGDVTPCPPRRQNPHMHMFEACLALHAATGRKEHLDRASTIASLLTGRMLDSHTGALPEYFDDAWSPASGDEGRICEPGHEFEWSWLLNQWSEAGGGDLLAAAERLRVHGEVYGIARPAGYVIDEVRIDGPSLKRTSRLWPQTERIKANVIRYEQTLEPMAALATLEAFDALQAYLATPVKGLWRDRRLEDGSFLEEPAAASSFYHIILALSELIRVADTGDQ